MNGEMFSDSPFSPSAPYLCCSDLLRPGSDRGRRWEKGERGGTEERTSHRPLGPDAAASSVP